MIKIVTKNTWELVIGGQLPEINRNASKESSKQKEARKLRDKKRYESQRG